MARDEGVGHRRHHKNFFLADAQQVVVERRALDDALRRAIQIGRLIHHHRRIARPARDHALAGFGRRLHHRRAARQHSSATFG